MEPEHATLDVPAFERIAVLVDAMGDVDCRHWVGAFDRKKRAGRERAKRLLRAQGGEGTFKPLKIERWRILGDGGVGFP